MNLYVLKTWLQARFSHDERGANLVEYILLIALIALVVVGAVVLLRQGIEDKFTDAKDCLDNSGTATSC